MDASLGSKLCFADNWDLKKSNKRKQASNGAALLPAFRFAILFVGALGSDKEKGSLWGLILPVISPQATLSSVWWGTSLLCHPEKAEGLIFPLPRSTQVSWLCRQLDFPYLLSAWFVFHSVHRHFDSLSGFWCNIYNVSAWDGYVRYF